MIKKFEKDKEDREKERKKERERYIIYATKQSFFSYAIDVVYLFWK